MAESKAFAWLCDELEQATPFSRVEARGTVRLALKEAGLRAEDLTPTQAASVALRMLPRELGSRRIDGAEAICQRLAQGLRLLPDERDAAAPDEVFAQLSKR